MVNALWDFGKFRVEGEFSYTDADISTLDTDTGPVSVGSQFTSSSFMVNALWDFDVEPFAISVGVGIGAANMTYDQMTNGGFIAVAQAEDTLFTGQLILRASYDLNETTSIGMNYRYQMFSDLSDRGYVDTGGMGPSDIKFDSVNVNYLELSCTVLF